MTSQRMIQTVLGPIPGESAGITLVHEHLVSDMTTNMSGYPPGRGERMTLATAAEARWNPAAFVENFLFDAVDEVIKELQSFRAAGGRTIVDATPWRAGRDPAVLQRISKATGINVVMGCGYYVARAHPPEVAELTQELITAALLGEITNGTEDAQIRPGVIGEIGTGDPIQPDEEKVLRAALHAGRESGLLVTIHLHPFGRGGYRVVEVCREERADLSRIVLGHVMGAVGDDDYQAALFDTGAFVAYDLMGFDHSMFGLGRYPPNDHQTVATIVAFAKRGYLNQILISQDIAVRTRLKAYGGWGYTHITDHIVPLMLDMGLTQTNVDQILIGNPRFAMEIRPWR